VSDPRNKGEAINKNLEESLAELDDELKGAHEALKVLKEMSLTDISDEDAGSYSELYKNNPPSHQEKTLTSTSKIKELTKLARDIRREAE